MTGLIREQEAWLEEKMKQPDADWEKVQNTHRIWISYLQHERLVHLAVTLTVAVLIAGSAVLVLIRPFILTFFLLAILVVMEIFYIFHYYRLENTVQHWYLLDRELDRKQGFFEQE